MFFEPAEAKFVLSSPDHGPINATMTADGLLCAVLETRCCDRRQRKSADFGRLQNTPLERFGVLTPELYVVASPRVGSYTPSTTPPARPVYCHLFLRVVTTAGRKGLVKTQAMI